MGSIPTFTVPDPGGKCVKLKNTFHMIWMGMGEPGDFVAPLNRFPVHNQQVAKQSNDRFVANLTYYQMVPTVRLFLYSVPCPAENDSTTRDDPPCRVRRTRIINLS